MLEREKLGLSFKKPLKEAVPVQIDVPAGHPEVEAFMRDIEVLLAKHVYSENAPLSPHWALKLLTSVIAGIARHHGMHRTDLSRRLSEVITHTYGESNRVENARKREAANAS